MPPRDTIWALEEQTSGKHAVLRAYLNAWFPILGTTQNRIAFIDGFAGPGQYTGGEVGSPIIAMQALINHASKSKITAEVRYLFLEKDEARAAHLGGLVDALRPQLPPGTVVELRTGEFRTHMTELLDAIAADGHRLVPSLVMIDPFGISEIPMRLIARILNNPRAEVYVSIMWEWIYRFKESPEFGPHLDELFGTPDWRHALAIPDADTCREALYRLYDHQLRRAGAEHVIHFDLYNGNRHVYTIFFATKSLQGCNKMKEAIWKAVPAGDYQFRGMSSDGQLSLEFERDLAPLQKELETSFGQAGPVSISDLDEWAMSDKTSFHKGHLRTALNALEDAGAIAVTRAPGKRRRTFPPGTSIQFVEPQRPSGSASSGTG